MRTIRSAIAKWRAKRARRHQSEWDFGGVDALAMIVRNQKSRPKGKLP